MTSSPQKQLESATESVQVNLSSSLVAMDVVHIEMAQLDTIEEDDLPPELPPKASSLMKELPSRMARRATLANTRRTSAAVPSHSGALHRRVAFKLKSRAIRRIEQIDNVDGGFDVHHPDYDEEDDQTFRPYLYESIDFKAVPLPMSKRRMFRDSLKLKGIADISRFKKALNLMHTTGKRCHSGLKDMLKNWELWRSDLKEVEGQFGSGVVSYFSFLRWLVFLNLLIFLLEYGFVVLPTVIICNGQLSANNVSGCGYVLSPIDVNANVTNDNTNILYDVLNFFTGEGWMRDTLMFYGNYPPKKLVSVEGVRYNLPLAYLLSGGAYFIFSFFFMISNLMSNLKESYIESDGIFSSSANKVFAAWDYCISDDNSAEHKHDVFVQEVNSDIAEQERQIRIKNRTYKEKIILYTIRTVINLFIVPTVWTSTFVLIFQAILSENNSKSTTKSASKVQQLINRYGYDLLIALAITVPNLILPLFFEFLSIFEDWGRDIELALNLWRRVFVKLPPLALLMFMQFKKFKDEIDDFVEDGSQSACSTCWENDVSAQMYMLIWVDFIVVVVTTLGLESLRKFLFQRCRCFRKIGMQQFDIPRNVLDLVYGQCLILIGTFFSPLVPTLAVIKLVILFYVKKVSLMHNNTLPDRPYQSAKSNFTFTLLLLLSFFMCIAIVGWGITRLPPSTCGPFSNNPCNVEGTIFGELSDEVNTWPRVIHDAVSMMGTAAILIPVLILFVVCLYYYRSVARAHRVVIRMLKEHLTFEAKLQRSLLKKLESQATYEKHDCADHGK
ncbi:transmembrane channel-like protein 7 [Exaiptasia diaphana]|uniref:TMC domain-containing protein n=1 Tax=Exaiptasia diaphana TaxID=2652724 RepID=A0A913XZF8_EXADI|nr:transmembrane channel-like protein 7 [Exaiptasia diaphana]